jgi:hypothetical protein
MQLLQFTLNLNSTAVDRQKKNPPFKPLYISPAVLRLISSGKKNKKKIERSKRKGKTREE